MKYIDVNNSYITFNVKKTDELDNECNINEEEKEQIKKDIEQRMRFASVMFGNTTLYEPFMPFIKDLLKPQPMIKIVKKQFKLESEKRIPLQEKLKAKIQENKKKRSRK
jgi:precorrin-2 methylase